MDQRVSLITLGVGDLAAARSAVVLWGREKLAAETSYGGYAAYFADLDGHLWEVAHNPGFTLTESGALVLPDELR